MNWVVDTSNGGSVEQEDDFEMHLLSWTYPTIIILTWIPPCPPCLKWQNLGNCKNRPFLNYLSCIVCHRRARWTRTIVIVLLWHWYQENWVQSNSQNVSITCVEDIPSVCEKNQFKITLALKCQWVSSLSRETKFAELSQILWFIQFFTEPKLL